MLYNMLVYLHSLPYTDSSGVCADLELHLVTVNAVHLLVRLFLKTKNQRSYTGKS